MGQFAELDLALRCASGGWPRNHAELAACEARYEHDLMLERQRLQEMSYRRRRDLSHAMARLHGDWNNLVGQQAYWRRVKRPAKANALQPAIAAAWRAYEEARQAYEAWLPCYEEDTT